jgi:3-methyladenine DNA glycosylase AlkC
MKNGLSTAAVNRIQQGLSAVLPHFNGKIFTAQCLQDLETLELKERVQHIITAITTQCPDFNSTAPALMELPKQWHSGDKNDALRGFAAWPVIDYVAVQGINDPALAFKVLEQLTPLFTAEFAIRPFIDQYPEQSFKQLLIWSRSQNEHVRRLASEGCRPRLPWGMQLKKLVLDPSPILPILQQLKDDESLYVRKSVANNINDITKDHPTIALALCEKWQPLASSNTQWIIKHGCRSLIKAGNERCLQLLGFNAAEISDITLTCPTQIVMGESLEFNCEFTSQKVQNLVVDYSIDFSRSNNKSSNKVFKIKNLNAANNERINVIKNYSFKAISTRKYYAGMHSLNIHLNGNIIATAQFEVINPD